MDKRESAILPIQVISLVMLSSIGIRLLALPAEVAKVAGRDGWIVTFIAGVIAIGEAYLLARHCMRFPRMYYAQTLYLIYGKIIGHVFNGFFVLLLLLTTGVALREFSATIRLTILNVTPPWAIWITMLLTSCYLVHNGLETMARLFDILFPVVVITGVAIAMAAVPQMTMSNLQPILVQEPAQLAKGVYIALRAFQQYAIIPVLLPHLRKKKGFARIVAIATGINVLVYTLSVIQCLAAFGPGETAYLVAPLLTLARSADVPGSIIERLEALLMVQWVPIAFALISSYHFVIETFFSKVWRVPIRFRPYTILALAAVIGFIASLPRDITVNIRISDIMDIFTTSTGLVFVPITYLIAVVTGKRGEQDEEKSVSGGRART